MPIYCFTSGDDEKIKGETIEGDFSALEVPDFVRKTADGDVVAVGLYEPIADEVVVYTRGLVVA
jgi:hypothetical protein